MEKFKELYGIFYMNFIVLLLMFCFVVGEKNCAYTWHYALRYFGCISTEFSQSNKMNNVYVGMTVKTQIYVHFILDIISFQYCCCSSWELEGKYYTL